MILHYTMYVYYICDMIYIHCTYGYIYIASMQTYIREAWSTNQQGGHTRQVDQLVDPAFGGWSGKEGHQSWHMGSAPASWEPA